MTTYESIFQLASLLIAAVVVATSAMSCSQLRQPVDRYIASPRGIIEEATDEDVDIVEEQVEAKQEIVIVLEPIADATLVVHDGVSIVEVKIDSYKPQMILSIDVKVDNNQSIETAVPNLVLQPPSEVVASIAAVLPIFTVSQVWFDLESPVSSLQPVDFASMKVTKLSTSLVEPVVFSTNILEASVVNYEMMHNISFVAAHLFSEPIPDAVQTIKVNVDQWSSLGLSYLSKLQVEGQIYASFISIVSDPENQHVILSSVPLNAAATSFLEKEIDRIAASGQPVPTTVVLSEISGAEVQVKIFAKDFLNKLVEKSTDSHPYGWAAPQVMSDKNAMEWSKKVVSYKDVPLARLQQIGPVFAYGEAVPTENEEDFVKQSEAISDAVAKGNNTIIVAYYGGSTPASVERLIDEVHKIGAKVLFAVACAETSADRSASGFGVQELDSVLDVVVAKADYLIPSWRGSSPAHIEKASAFSMTIARMALEKNPNMVMFGMADVNKGRIITMVVPGSSAIVLASPVMDKTVLYRISDTSAAKFGAPGARVVCGPVCFPSIYVKQDQAKVDALSAELARNGFGFFRLHGDGHQEYDAMTK